MLGASSLDDLVNRLDATKRISNQDTRITREAEAFRTEIQRREAELERARAEQERVLADQAAKKASIESQLAERQRLLSTIKSEIARIRREEAAQQARLEAQAEERLDSTTAAPATETGGAGGNPAGTRAGSWESQCSTSGSPTSGEARLRAASTAPV